MTKLQKQKIKNLDSDNMALRKSIKHYKIKVLRLEKLLKEIKPKQMKEIKPKQKSESKKEKNERVINGINELKKRGIMQ